MHSIPRIIRFLWLLNPITFILGWRAYDVINYKGNYILIGAIKKNTPPRKDDPKTLKIFWTNISK